MRRRAWLYLLIGILLFFPLGYVQSLVDYRRKVENLEDSLVLMPGQMAGSLVLGGFKSLAADLLWLNMEEYWHTGQHYKVLPVLETVSWLQPNYILVWSIGGWHMAYNIYAEVKDPTEKQYWYDQGVKFLKKGIGYNPDKYDLHFELGWTYYNKGKDYANAVKCFERATRFPHPEYVNDVLAHAYEKNGQIDKAIEEWTYVRDNYLSFMPIAERMLLNLKTRGTTTPPEEPTATTRAKNKK